jgi:glutathione peroxidase
VRARPRVGRNRKAVAPRAHTDSLNLSRRLPPPFHHPSSAANEFGGQEPGDGIEIPHCVQYVRPGNGFIPDFPLTVKISTNGGFADSTFKAAKAVCAGFGSGATKDDVSWNFETWLFGRDGKPFKRYATAVDPITMAGDIEFLLNASATTA